jgi:hypothetical protein
MKSYPVEEHEELSSSGAAKRFKSPTMTGEIGS